MSNADPTVIRCYNNPGIPKPLQARYTAEGLFVSHFDSGWSFDSKDVPDKDRRPAAGNAFNRIMELSRTGGVGLIRTPNDDDEIITVGEWEPNCVTLREVNGAKLKGAQMSRFGLVVPEDDSFEELDSLYDDGSSTVDVVTPHEDKLKSTISKLEREGRLRSPTYR